MTDPVVVRAVHWILPRDGSPIMAETAARWTGFTIYDVRGALITLRLAGLVRRRRHIEAGHGQSGWEWYRPMSSWTHLLCRTCWEDRVPNHEPITVANAPFRPCCGCGAITTSGIFIREDPVKLRCHGNHGEDGP